MILANLRNSALIALVLAQGESARSPTEFEVASIRRNVNGGLNTGFNFSGGRVTATNATLKTLIRNAYDILSFQFAGGPDWLDTEYYDIAATTGGSGKISPDQFRLLLRNLLADRFQLKVHRETRETNIYALVIAKNGPKIKPNTGANEPSINGQFSPRRGQSKATNEPISILATNLGNRLGTVVIDKTGLTGGYDWLLVWDPDPTPDSTNPSMFTALQEQLGLRLVSQRGPVEVLVIDRAERPSEN